MNKGWAILVLLLGTAEAGSVQNVAGPAATLKLSVLNAAGEAQTVQEGDLVHEGERLELRVESQDAPRMTLLSLYERLEVLGVDLPKRSQYRCGDTPRWTLGFRLDEQAGRGSFIAVLGPPALGVDALARQANALGGSPAARLARFTGALAAAHPQGGYRLLHGPQFRHRNGPRATQLSDARARPHPCAPLV